MGLLNTIAFMLDKEPLLVPEFKQPKALILYVFGLDTARVNEFADYLDDGSHIHVRKFTNVETLISRLHDLTLDQLNQLLIVDVEPEPWTAAITILDLRRESEGRLSQELQKYVKLHIAYARLLLSNTSGGCPDNMNGLVEMSSVIKARSRDESISSILLPIFERCFFDNHPNAARWSGPPENTSREIETI